MSALWVTHDAAQVRRIADRVLRVEHGRSLGIEPGGGGAAGFAALVHVDLFLRTVGSKKDADAGDSDDAAGGRERSGLIVGDVARVIPDRPACRSGCK